MKRCDSGCSRGRLLKQLYSRFSNEMDAGMIAVSGAFYRSRMGWTLPRQGFNELDIVIVNGVDGDRIAVEVENMFAKEHYRFEAPVKSLHKHGVKRISTNEGMIHLHRADMSAFTKHRLLIVPGISMVTCTNEYQVEYFESVVTFYQANGDIDKIDKYTKILEYYK